MGKITKVQRIQIKGLFGKKNIDWKIKEEHRVSVLVGKNGAGKSTILRILQRLLTADYKQLENYDFNSISVDLDSMPTISYENMFRRATKVLRERVVQNIVKSEKNKSTDLVEDLLEELVKKYGNYLLGEIAEETLFKNQQKLNSYSEQVTYLSTIDMSAGAINIVKNINGDTSNVLNDAIMKVYEKLLSYSEDNQINLCKIEESINKFLCDSKKKCILKDGSIFITDSDQLESKINSPIFKNLDAYLNIEKLSSGERQLIYIIFSVALASVNGALILMDEPEISLHLEWQERLLKELSDLNTKSQMIVVTHSPAIIMNGWRNSYYNFKDITANGQLSK